MSDLTVGVIVLGFAVAVIVTIFVLTVVIPDRRDRRYLVMKRADQQHDLFCRGDLRGVYGSPETVQHMQTINDWKADDE